MKLQNSFLICQTLASFLYVYKCKFYCSTALTLLNITQFCLMFFLVSLLLLSRCHSVTSDTKSFELLAFGHFKLPNCLLVKVKCHSHNTYLRDASEVARGIASISCVQNLSIFIWQHFVVSIQVEHLEDSCLRLCDRSLNVLA